MTRDAVATLLSRHPCGRILLHIAAMIGDGQLQWHCAGIARETAFFKVR
jgi:hypothetical protein